MRLDELSSLYNLLRIRTYQLVFPRVVVANPVYQLFGSHYLQYRLKLYELIKLNIKHIMQISKFL